MSTREWCNFRISCGTTGFMPVVLSVRTVYPRILDVRIRSAVTSDKKRA